MNNFYEWIFEQELDLNKTILSTQSVDYTYLNIHNDVNRYVDLLKPLGEIKNKKVAVIVPKVDSFISIVLAISKLGGIIIPLSPLLRKDDLLAVLDFSDPHIVFTVKNHQGFHLAAAVNSWADSSGKETHIFESDDNLSWEINTIFGETRPLENEGIHIIGCTSGSTGTPKGIVCDMNLVRTADLSYRFVNEISEEDDVFIMAPASGLFGLCWLLSSLHSQYHIVMTESFSFPDIIKLVEEKPCRKLITTPSLFRALDLFCKSSGSSALEPLELITLAGEAISDDFIASVSNTRSLMRGFYGFSELGCIMYTEKDIREGLNWSLVPNVEYKAVAQSDDGIGELLFKNGNEFLGYYKRPDLTAEVYSDNWFYSGDLAKVTVDGKIEIIGRKKDMIKKGGQQVIPGEIERFLNSHPSVQKSVVVGVPHSVYGEQIVAYIVKDQDDIDVKELINYCHANIARYKVPDQIKFIDEIPIVQGKTDKVSLRKLALTK
ncbi:long-chain fatty acid--CoA ligase [Bacillus canaveralius]|uniref:Long-chain fatty acid--CoA ligase n=1 Tax=Bacillus canaveralius TaxID=1403243 RepID=A0A2N5GN09_9BACI|nr:MULTISPECIES: class I adenylate-forming enzyme family protein [Bacillus]PLR81363.1 long-chain fatty acid--CoA ligase [Bacillus sp. V33-4]PLR83550.1 long-chain fatty acid--CoA ligase [Bacillus canaveralius]PLS00736.1 long-chain fatty acid--CoA ligase [Bacillus canaveralius]RSK48625.1 long-chain fatty acid--CoA ligase [Bacillus canaveralius]